MLSGLSSGEAIGVGTNVDTSGSAFAAPTIKREYGYAYDSEGYGYGDDYGYDGYYRKHRQHPDYSYEGRDEVSIKRYDDHGYRYNLPAYGCDEDAYGIGWESEYSEHCKHHPYDTGKR